MNDSVRLQLSAIKESIVEINAHFSSRTSNLKKKKKNPLYGSRWKVEVTCDLFCCMYLEFIFFYTVACLSWLSLKQTAL